MTIMDGNNTRFIYCFAELVRNYELHKHTLKHRRLKRFRYSFTITYAYDISFLHVLPLRISYETDRPCTSRRLTVNHRITNHLA